MSIHPTALISPKARIGRDCVFGPFCIIEDDVEIGDGCVFEAHSIVKSGTVMGNENHVFEGAVIGGHPQCLGLACSKGKAVIGDRNLFRENCTVHRSKEDDGVTQIGSDNMLMVNVHVAHDCRIGDRVLISNNTMLAGHVVVESRAVLSGAVGVHQFVWIGQMTMVGGQAHVTQDIPPFTRVDGKSTGIVGLNCLGLKRNGLRDDEISDLKQAYKIMYGQGLTWPQVVAALREKFPGGRCLELAKFIEDSLNRDGKERRGITRDRLSFRRRPENDA